MSYAVLRSNGRNPFFADELEAFRDKMDAGMRSTTIKSQPVPGVHTYNHRPEGLIGAEPQLADLIIR